MTWFFLKAKFFQRARCRNQGRAFGKLGLVEKGTDAPRHFVICLWQMKSNIKRYFDTGYVPWAGFVSLPKADEMYCRDCEYFHA